MTQLPFESDFQLESPTEMTSPIWPSQDKETTIEHLQRVIQLQAERIAELEAQL